MADAPDTVCETPPALSGQAVAAVLLMLLDEADAASILRELEADAVRNLGAAMLEMASAGEEVIDMALQQFVQESRSVSALAASCEPHVRNIMNTALGQVRADNILADLAPRTGRAGLEVLKWMEPAAISRLLIEEHPQVGALILAALTPETAAAALTELEEKHQADLIYRAARLESVSAEAIADLEEILAAATDLRAGKPPVRLGGRSEAARIVNTLRKPDVERLLKTLKKRDRELGQAIEEEMFVFDDLNELDAKNLGAVLRSVDAATLGLALKGAEAKLVERMLQTMSARASQAIRDDIAERGPVKRAEVEEAQKAIVAIARQLAEEGAIMLGTAGDEYV